jgi:hypothetical protein
MSYMLQKSLKDSKVTCFETLERLILRITPTQKTVCFKDFYLQLTKTT